jgi:hypothetical protein
MVSLKKAVEEYQSLHNVPMSECVIFETVKDGIIIDLGSAQAVQASKNS